MMRTRREGIKGDEAPTSAGQKMKENNIRYRKRKPLFALALSFFLTGLGQLYNGRARKGILFFLASALFPLLFFLLGILGPDRMLLGFLAVSIAASLGIFVWAAVDAWKEARRKGENFQLKFYNRLSIYILLAVGLNLLTMGGIVDWERVLPWAPYRITTASMAPTLLPGDLIMVDNRIDRSAENHGLKRGELVVFNDPQGGANPFIKRVVGLPGDRIEIRGGTLYTNGVRRTAEDISAPRKSQRTHMQGEREDSIIFLEEGDLGTYSISLIRGREREDLTATVPEGSCFVLGDYRDNSLDSRHFGSIPLDVVLARARLVYFSKKPGGGIRWKRIGTDLTMHKEETR